MLDFRQIPGIFLGVIVVSAMPESHFIALAVAAVVATVAFLAWDYSPLPNHNGGFMGRNDYGRYWGFSDGENE